MKPNLRRYLQDKGLDCLLFIGDSLCDSDLYYLSNFSATDRFTLLAAEKITLLVSSMELGRAVEESSADEVVCTSDYGIKEKLKATDKPSESYILALAEFLRDRGVSRIGVPQRFPAGIFSSLCRDFSVSIVESPISKWREVKSEVEILAISSVQRSCQRAMNLAVRLISRSKVMGGNLFFSGGLLTSEKVRRVIELSLLKEGCDAVDTIVSGGAACANPHSRGSGPLPSNAPIVIDIFPRSKKTRYFADMTRTVVRGEADLRLLEMYQAVLQAQGAGLAAVQAGIDGRDVHAKVSQVFDDYGYRERDNKGFIHSTGHGVGLEIHESPSLSEAGGVLEAGSVVTVEPGLYYPDIGGVRLEDLVVVRKGGCDNLADFEKRLVL